MWVKALLKRVELDSGNISDSIITVGSLEMDIDAHLLKFDGKVITGITGREFKIVMLVELEELPKPKRSEGTTLQLQI